MDEVGVIHGRFQMLHKGHMEYLLAGKERCRYLIIGICNPDVSLAAYSSASPKRSTEKANPLSYYERFQMIRGSMLEAGVPLEEFDIVPFPINYPELIFNYVPRDAKYYMTIYDQWGYEKKKSLEKLGCDIEIMWIRSDADRFTSGTEVRSFIHAGKEWRQLVPDFVYKYMVSNKIDQRIRKHQ